MEFEIKNNVNIQYDFFYEFTNGLLDNLKFVTDYAYSCTSCGNNFLIKTVYYISKLINKTEEGYKYLYNNYDCIKHAIDNTEKMIHLSFAKIIGKRLEPDANFWMSISCMSINKTVSPFFSERIDTTEIGRYESNADIITLLNSNSNSFSRCIKYCLLEQNICLNTIIDPIFIAKIKSIENEIFYFSKRTDFSRMSLSLRKSTTKFISITYTNKTGFNDINIPIYLEKEWFLSGNHLLTPTFVMRYLEYQSSPYYFDDEYIIHIIDDNINCFQIDSTQYILLKDESYEVITIPIIEQDNSIYAYADQGSDLDEDTDADDDAIENTDNDTDEANKEYYVVEGTEIYDSNEMLEKKNV